VGMLPTFFTRLTSLLAIIRKITLSSARSARLALRSALLQPAFMGAALLRSAVRTIPALLARFTRLVGSTLL